MNARALHSRAPREHEADAGRTPSGGLFSVRDRSRGTWPIKRKSIYSRKAYFKVKITRKPVCGLAAIFVFTETTTCSRQCHSTVFLKPPRAAIERFDRNEFRNFIRLFADGNRVTHVIRGYIIKV